jgi:cell division protein FtsL
MNLMALPHPSMVLMIVRKLLNRRSMIVLLLTFVVTAALCVIFVLVPSRRL